tara:strand:+ start:22793 stop:23053 length:261 start_codon:yes stop_codon:yes gene_type:complete
MDNFMWLDAPIHVNYFKFDMSDEIKNMLMISYDGTIVAVNKDLIAKTFDSSESRMIRLGMESPPRNFKVKSEEDFIKYMSYQQYSD